METDYQIEEITDAEPGEPHHRVIGFLQHDPLATPLIEARVFEERDGLRFKVINQRPCVEWKTSSPTPISIYPELHKAQAILTNTIREARKLEKMMKAIEMAMKNG